MESLKKLVLNDNDFTGTLPSSLSALTKLQVLRVDSNWLRGEIPTSLSSLSALTLLEFHANLFSGTLPSSLCALTQLDLLRIDDNKLRGGGIPPCLGQLHNLTVLCLDGNALGGSIPAELVGASSLNTLVLGNMHLQGNVSSSFFSSFPALQTLRLNDNDLSGALPDLQGLTNLAVLDVGSNCFTGVIPSSFSKLTRLDMLAVSGNRLQGPIPSLVGMTGLTNLRLDHNKFTGDLPDWIGDLSNLQFLAMFENQFQGSLPTSWSGLHNMKQLLLQNNDLRGGFPALVGRMTGLELLRLDINRFSGDFKANLSALTKLRYLRVNNNQLEGEIDKSILGLPSLEYLNVAQNKLQGDLPALLRSLSPAVRFVGFADNAFGGSGDWDVLAANLTVLNFSFNLLDSARLTAVELAAPSLIDLRGTWLTCPFPSFASSMSVSSSGPLPCTPDLSLLAIEVLVVLAVVAAFVGWSAVMAYRTRRRYVEFVSDFFGDLKHSTLVTVRVSLRLATIALLPFFFAAAFRNLEYAAPICKEIDNGFIFGHMLSWPLSCFPPGTPAHTPLPSTKNWTFAEYTEEVISAGPCYTNKSLYVKENQMDFFSLCASVQGCQAVRSSSGWLTCAQAELAPLPIFGTREVVRWVLQSLLVLICVKELLKVLCLLLSRRRGVPVLRDFANTSFLMPFVLYGSPVRDDFNYRPTRREFFMRFVVDSLGESVPVLFLGVYFRLTLLHTNLDALATATLPLSLLAVIFSLCRLCTPQPSNDLELLHAKLLN